MCHESIHFPSFPESANIKVIYSSTDPTASAQVAGESREELMLPYWAPVGKNTRSFCSCTKLCRGHQKTNCSMQNVQAKNYRRRCDNVQLRLAFEVAQR